MSTKTILAFVHYGTPWYPGQCLAQSRAFHIITNVRMAGIQWIYEKPLPWTSIIWFTLKHPFHSISFHFFFEEEYYLFHRVIITFSKLASSTMSLCEYTLLAVVVYWKYHIFWNKTDLGSSLLNYVPLWYWASYRHCFKLQYKHLWNQNVYNLTRQCCNCE